MLCPRPCMIDNHRRKRNVAARILRSGEFTPPGVYPVLPRRA
jgi:hypothetical protein